MSGRLLVVSNRIPLGGQGSGGLVVALHEALSEQGGVWIGAEDIEGDEPGDALRMREGGAYEKLTFDLTPQDREEYYLGFANSVLWPLCHRRTDLISFETRYAEGYARVNARLAGMLARLLRPEDRLWIQDYHFLPLAAELRALGVENRIGFFLHIPFPNVSDLPALPGWEAVTDWIAACDLFGLQTQRDVSACLEFIRGAPDAELMLDGMVRRGRRTVRVASFPIGIDPDALTAAADARRAEAKMRLGAQERLLIGVDRLDYSKGIPNRLRAMGAYLDRLGPDEPRTVLLQIAPPSRQRVLAYREIRDEVELLTGKINGAHSEIDWTPVRYIHKPVDRSLLAALFRRADLGLVTSLADGMNLVAKEYVASQDPENPGVLVLSRFAGAAEQMPEALVVNPYDIDEIADAIATGLAMPLAERRERHAALLDDVRRRDIRWWTTTFLEALDQRPGRPDNPPAAKDHDGGAA